MNTRIHDLVLIPSLGYDARCGKMQFSVLTGSLSSAALCYKKKSICINIHINIAVLKIKT